jgi:hypothetical protein
VDANREGRSQKGTVEGPLVSSVRHCRTFRRGPDQAKYPCFYHVRVHEHEAPLPRGLRTPPKYAEFQCEALEAAKEWHLNCETGVKQAAAGRWTVED